MWTREYSFTYLPMYLPTWRGTLSKKNGLSGFIPKFPAIPQPRVDNCRANTCLKSHKISLSVCLLDTIIYYSRAVRCHLRHSWSKPSLHTSFLPSRSTESSCKVFVVDKHRFITDSYVSQITAELRISVSIAWDIAFWLYQHLAIVSLWVVNFFDWRNIVSCYSAAIWSTDRWNG